MKVELTEFGDDRKEFVQIDKWDTWNMCDDLALIILPMLKQLRETNHGAGSTDDNDVPEHLRSTNAEPKENEWDTDSLWFDRWNWIMDEMIWAFEQIVDEDAENQFYSGQIEFVSEPMAFDEDGEATLFELKRGPNDTSDFDKEGWTKWNDRINRGTTFFGKYYRSLWD